MNSTKSISQYNCQQNGEIYAFFDQILMAQKMSIYYREIFCILHSESAKYKWQAFTYCCWDQFGPFSVAIAT